MLSTDELRPEAASLKIVAVDEKKNSITFEVIDGDLKKLYSMYRFTVQVTGKGNNYEGNGSTVKIIIEYEKRYTTVPEPTTYLAFATLLHKAFDAYLVMNKE